MPVDSIATNDFKANPFGFLANNLLLGPILPALQHNKSEHLALEDESPNGRTATVGGHPAGLYRVVKAGASAAYFRAYIADYEEGSTTFTTLGTNMNALFCFTVNMNGCTFGMGSQAMANGTLVVSHGNAKNAGPHKNIPSILGDDGPLTAAMQISKQYQRAKDGHVTGRVFAPEHYRADAQNSTTFLYRSQNELWRLFCMVYTLPGFGRYVSPGVQRAPTRAIA